jgi:hypothetical protein
LMLKKAAGRITIRGEKNYDYDYSLPPMPIH